MHNPDRDADVCSTLVPTEGDLRFVKRVDRSDVGHPSERRILQRYEWSHTLKKHDWFDVVMVGEVDDENT